MTKAISGDFHAALSAASGKSKHAAKELANAYADAVLAEMQRTGEVILPGLGRFSTKTRKATSGLGPRGPWQSPEKRKVHFTAFGALKETVA